jgi:hypothetical protein
MDVQQESKNENSKMKNAWKRQKERISDLDLDNIGVYFHEPTLADGQVRFVWYSWLSSRYPCANCCLISSKRTQALQFCTNVNGVETAISRHQEHILTYTSIEMETKPKHHVHHKQPQSKAGQSYH